MRGVDKYKVVACVVCGETDYADTMDRIDGKPYCNICDDEAFDKLFDKLVEAKEE